MAEGAILACVGVSKSYGGRVALDDASLDIAQGSITGVIGPNGSGKSTLFNCIAGTVRPDSGRIAFMGREITNATPAEVCALAMPSMAARAMRSQ